MCPVKRWTGSRMPRVGDDAFEQRPGFVDVALRRHRELEAELRDQPVQRPLEVGDDLPGVVAGGAARDAIALDQQHAAIGVAQQEERGGDPGDAGADDRDVGVGIRIERRRRASAATAARSTATGSGASAHASVGDARVGSQTSRGSTTAGRETPRGAPSARTRCANRLPVGRCGLPSTASHVTKSRPGSSCGSSSTIFRIDHSAP